MDSSQQQPTTPTDGLQVPVGADAAFPPMPDFTGAPLPPSSFPPMPGVAPADDPVLTPAPDPNAAMPGIAPLSPPPMDPTVQQLMAPIAGEPVPAAPVLQPAPEPAPITPPAPELAPVVTLDSAPVQQQVPAIPAPAVPHADPLPEAATLSSDSPDSMSPGDIQTSIVEDIRAVENILVTVSSNPTVDELSAALGLALILDQLEKRCAAVFSGNVPPAITFLYPERTFENTADSLRDFIIALDKEKADHLRYKVDGDLVKIFITPYKTVLSQKDLEFTQGEFNIELVLALGVTSSEQLDKALDASPNILHDAKIVTVTSGDKRSTLGSVDWHDSAASSLSEMIVSLAQELGGAESLLDEQIATALMTGIVSATERFSNTRTNSNSLTIAAELMAAGANQQLIAAKLAEAHDIKPARKTAKKSIQKSQDQTSHDGTELSITHDDEPTDKPRFGGGIETESEADDLNSDLEKLQSDLSTSVDDDSSVGGFPPLATLQSATDLASDTDAESSLESGLADIGAASTGATISDIEKDLENAATEATQPEQAASFPPVPSDAAMPDFEEPQAAGPDLQQSAPVPGNVDTAIASLPPLPALPGEDSSLAVTEPAIEQPLQTASTEDFTPSSNLPEISGHKDAPSVSDDKPAINGTDAIMADRQIIDPFAQPVNGASGAVESPFGTSAEPELTGGGTPDVAAALAGSDTATIADSPIEEPGGLPGMPALPPLPGDVSSVPLPPPPPPPSVFGAADGETQSGAVSGDVFGDSSKASEPAASSDTAVAEESNDPNQFKIPAIN